MKHKIFSSVILCVLLISFCVYAINFLTKETYNSVVVVHTSSGVGSGFYIGSNMIITNEHVVENMSDIKKETQDRKFRD